MADDFPNRTYEERAPTRINESQETKQAGIFFKYTAMIAPKEKVGLNMPDFDIVNNSLKVTWIKGLNDSPHDACWSHIPLAYLNNVGGRFLFECNYELKSMKVNIPLDFYKEALEEWQKLTVSTPESKEQTGITGSSQSTGPWSTISSGMKLVLLKLVTSSKRTLS